ncbi:MAG: methyltransferase domain-containing protein [Xanthobacteraceae bacterium]
MVLREEAFDEERYLEENPDVLNAVKAGKFDSGLDHFLQFGAREGRPGPPTFSNPPEFTFPATLPPAHLRKRVHGTTHIWLFERAGKRVAQDVLAAVRPHLALESRSHVLDFGCGCGRVAAYFRAQVDCDFTGADIDHAAVSWCQENLSGLGTFVRNEHAPPLPFADGQFSFVYCISVFTHLPEALQNAWLWELRRVTRPGGLLLISTRGLSAVPHGAWQRLRFRWRGFRYEHDAITEGLPEFYQLAFHNEAYIRRQWSKTFEIVKFQEKGINMPSQAVIGLE